MDLNSISSAPYLSSEEGLAMLRDATTAVRIALQKIDNLKQYVKQKMSVEPISTNAKPFVKSEDTSVDDQDNLNFVEVNQDHVTEIQNVHDIQSQISCTSIPTKNLEDLQIFFSILNNSITENDVEEAFKKAGFNDCKIIVKNKEDHSFGFIKFSDEKSVKDAINLSYKILIFGKPMRIFPYKKNVNALPENVENVPNCISRGPESVQTIEENLLINISCGYGKVISSEHDLRYKEVNINEETNVLNYTDPSYITGGNSFIDDSPSKSLHGNKTALNSSIFSNTNETENNQNCNYLSEEVHINFPPELPKKSTATNESTFCSVANNTSPNECVLLQQNHQHAQYGHYQSCENVYKKRYFSSRSHQNRQLVINNFKFKGGKNNNFKNKNKVIKIKNCQHNKRSFFKKSNQRS